MNIFDGHNDTLTNLHLPERGKGRSFFAESNIGHIDLPRALRGGLIGGVFTVFTPPQPESPERDPMFGLTVSDGGYEVVPRSEIDHAYAVLFTNAVLETLDQLISEANGAVQLVRMADDIEECVRRKRFAIVPGFEGAEAIREDLSNLAGYYQQGLRALGPVWSRPNRFVEGVPFRFPGNTYTGPGLSATGRELVRECNRLGIVIDLAHINMRGFRDVAQLSQAPLVVSHTDVHALCSSAARLIRAFGMPFQLIRIEVNVAKISGAVPFCLVVKVPGVRMTALAACHYRLPG